MISFLIYLAAEQQQQKTNSKLTAVLSSPNFSLSLQRQLTIVYQAEKPKYTQCSWYILPDPAVPSDILFHNMTFLLTGTIFHPFLSSCLFHSQSSSFGLPLAWLVWWPWSQRTWSSLLSKPDTLPLGLIECTGVTGKEKNRRQIGRERGEGGKKKESST